MLHTQFAALALAATTLVASGCGESSKTTTTSAAATPRSVAPSSVNHPLRDRRDRSDSEVLDFGHPAGPAARRAVTTLVERYYAAAAAANGAAACPLILPSLARALPESYGRGPGPNYLHGSKTCQEVMSRLFRHLHPRLAAADATLEVTRVRLKTRGGYAVLRFGAPPEREITVVHQNGAWKISSLLDSELF